MKIKRFKSTLTAVTATALIAGCSHFFADTISDPVIVQKPIIFDEQREQLSLEYLNKRYNMVQDKATIDPKMVVVHYTVIPTFEATFRTFNPSTLPAHRSKISSASNLNVSSHYVVDRDGTIYQLLPDTTFARHVIGLNHSAIGIENIADGDKYPLTDAQLKANIELINSLGKKFSLDYVIGHHEYDRFVGHELWKETNPDYLTEKSDPGDAFMFEVRDALSGLDLKPLPVK